MIALRVHLHILQFPPDVNSTGLLMQRVAVELAKRGHDVSVVSSFPHYARFRVEEPYRGRFRERGREGPLDVTRVWVYANGRKANMLFRLASYLSFNVLGGLEAIARRPRPDVILATNGSFFSGIAAGLAAKLRGVPFVYNIQDLYPDTPVEAGQLRNPVVIWILRRLESASYRLADQITVITPSFQHAIVAKGVPSSKLRVVPNFVDTEFIRPLPRENALSERLGLSGKFVVAHAGNIGYVYDLDAMLDSAALLRERADILFLIVGEGVDKPRLEQRAKDMGLANVRFLPYVPRDDLPWLRASCDVQVSLYRRGSSKNSFASKIYEIMSSGRPVLASADEGSDVWRLIEETGAGMTIPLGDPAALAEAVLRLRDDRELAASMGKRGRGEVEMRYSAEAIGAKYASILEALDKPLSRPRG